MGGKIRKIEQKYLTSQRNRKKRCRHSPLLAHPECRRASCHPQSQAKDRQQAESGERHVQAGALIDAKSENPDSGESSHRNSGIPAAEGVPVQAGRQQSRARAEQRRE